MHAPTAAVRTSKLCKRFATVIAVDRLDLEVPAKAIFGLLGSNGAGKTTTIKMLTTLLPPTAGEAEVAGADLRREPQAVRSRIGYVSQMLSADGELTGYENLLLSAKLHGMGRSERAARIREVLSYMGLTDAEDRLVNHYSGGMIRRLEIAQAMLHRPAVLFLDEPTIGLDPVARRAVWQRIRSLRDDFGTTVVMTTHDMEEAEALCEIVAFMSRGVLTAVGAPQALKAGLGASATLDDVFVRYTGAPSSAGRDDMHDVAGARRTAHRLE